MADPISETAGHPPDLHIDIARAGDRLKISAFEQTGAEAHTVCHYDEIPIPLEKITGWCHEIVRTLNMANRRGQVPHDVLVKLKEIGQIFSDDLFTPHVKEMVSQTRADHLIIHLDDQMVHVPWELLYDGRRFLCQRFGMGRLVRTRQNCPGGNRPRSLGDPLRMLILADPAGDLRGAYAEGVQLRDRLDLEKKPVQAALCADNISPDFVREKIRQFDMVHFAGHCDYDGDDPGNSGWRLTDGHLRAREIMKMAGTDCMPAFVFSNACQSARTGEWAIRDHFNDEIFGLANAFVLSGVKHYVGTFWEIPDEPGQRFALEFYRCLLGGESVGLAVRNARQVLVREYGEETIVWGSYLLYGDPTFNYMGRIRQKAPAPPARPSYRAAPEIRGRGAEEVIDFGAGKAAEKRKPRFLLKTVIGGLILAAFLLWGYPGFLKNYATSYEKAVVSLYRAGDFEKALQACQALESNAPGSGLAHLIRGDILLRTGKPDAARAAYRKTLEVPDSLPLQKSRALMGLGRIASLRGESDEALACYRQATAVVPENPRSYVAQAMLMQSRGDDEAALHLLSGACELMPEDKSLAAMLSEIRQKVSRAQDQERQKRIDQMVRDLIENMAEQPEIRPSDAPDARPVTLWVMDFETMGYGLQEGENRLLRAGLTHALMKHKGLRLVERDLLEHLLAELKLGTSRLADRPTALSLGRLLAARLILTGQLVHAGPHTQVNLRLIETETGEITAAMTETFDAPVSAAVMADKLAGKLWGKLRGLYSVQER